MDYSDTACSDFQTLLAVSSSSTDSSSQTEEDSEDPDGADLEEGTDNGGERPCFWAGCFIVGRALGLSLRKRFKRNPGTAFCVDNHDTELVGS